MSVSPWVALKTLRQLGIQPVIFNALYRLGLISGHYRRWEAREQRRENAVQGKMHDLLRPLLTLPSPEELLAVLGKDGKIAILAEADEIVAGKVRLFGAEPVELTLSLPGKLLHWSAYETGRADLRTLVPRASSELTSDIKLIWEPARFGWVFCLGRAFHLTREEKYADSFWHNFETFSSANPPFFGPNWSSGQEVALRLIAFVWAAQVFISSTSSTPERNAALAGAVALHALRIPPTLVYARSQQNNHLLTEAAGLLTAGLALPDHPKASRWCVLGWNLLNKGLQSQIDSSGEYAQHSNNYHRLMLQVVLWTDALIRSNDFSRYYWPPRTEAAILRSIHWLLSMLDPDSGRTPNLGANDGAYIFPLTVCPFSDHRPVLNAAARAFPGYALPRGPWDEMALWFGIPLEQRRVVPLPGEPGDQVSGKESWAYLRTAQFTNRPSHADQLHVDLWWRGLNVAQDAGTYRYNADPPWDNSLTTALVHNTVTVNGRDQFTRAGRFLYLDWFNADRCSSPEADPGILKRLRGVHAGYRKQGVRHERTITAWENGHWSIQDDLLSLRSPSRKKPLTFRLHWLLPDWEWRVESSPAGIVLRLTSPYGPVGLYIRVTGGKDVRVELVRAGERLYSFGGGSQMSPTVAAMRGWASPTYGVKVAVLSLSVKFTSSNDVQFTSEFIFPI